MFLRRKKKNRPENVGTIVREEFSRMPTLYHENDQIHIQETGFGHQVDYHSFRDPGTFYYFMFNSNDTAKGPLAPKTAYQRQIGVSSQGKGYGRELIETGERIFKRLGISDVQVDDPFNSPVVWNQNPRFWEHLGYIGGHKNL